ncbi:UBX domain-containing protein 1-like isoform X1 [Camellia sinensis]|uniref:UBX domain-containing protein 1-like isoform X1 n=1 Tax=Camellia sinensis TaxID=4442 RepID=UPI001036DB16|nr:UBX domain-containing protein 1-like isoform X1 [Camellia sinensis]XP_028083762.1 UBX domain-containing protein 1-like isoform X1 [Camellia sinensis]
MNLKIWDFHWLKQRGDFIILLINLNDEERWFSLLNFNLMKMALDLFLYERIPQGNSSIDAAVNWLFDHENDPDIDQMPLVPVPINIEAYDPSYITEQVKLKAQELRDRACGKKEEEETKVEREREKDQAHRKKEKEEKKVEREMEKYQARRKKEEEEKKVEREREKVCLRYLERIKAGKELLEAKRIQEENERKRSIALWKAEKEKENRERDKIRQKLQQDKAERRRRLGLPLDDPPSVNNASTLMQKEKNSLPVKSASLPVKSNSLPVVTVTKEEIMRDCLRSLKRNHMDNVTKVRRAFQTLLIYVKNVVKNPNEEKFRKIRFNNPAFQDRVGNMKEGIEFLELCGFERVDEGKFLFLPEDKVDIAVLKSAGNVLDSAITNPFFGLLSSSREDEAFGLGE